MSDIQRWTPRNGIDQYNDGPYVLYSDHAEALRQAEESLAAMYRARLSAYDEGQRDALAKHVNPDCVWGQGECIPDCPSCKRMDELYAERVAGAREATVWAVQRVEALDSTYLTDMWVIRADAIAAINGVSE